MITITSRRFTKAMADSLLEHALWGKAYRARLWTGRILSALFLAVSGLGFGLECWIPGVFFLLCAAAALIWTVSVVFRCRRDVLRDFSEGMPWNRTYVIEEDKLAVIRGYEVEYLNWNWLIYWKEQSETLMLVFGGNPRMVLLDKRETGRESLLAIRRMLYEHGIPAKESRPYSRGKELAVTFGLAILAGVLVSAGAAAGKSVMSHRIEEQETTAEVQMEERQPAEWQAAEDQSAEQQALEQQLLEQQQIEEQLLERSHFLENNPYYPEVCRYQEQVRGILDVSGLIEPLFETDKRYFSEEEFSECGDTVLMIARNEIFARRGRIFSNPDLQNYFLGQVWYEPQIPADEFDETVFNDWERANLELIIEVERKRKGNETS